MAKPNLILASASPRRRELLEQIGVNFTVQSADIDETVKAGEAPEDYVQRLAVEKAKAVASQCGGGEAVLGSDTTVVSADGDILGKPTDQADAVRMLALLAGRAHTVLTAVALCYAGETNVALSRSEVTFRDVSAAEAKAYWQSGEPRGKAGGYAIQGLGAVFVEHLAGSYSGVMGLPLAQTAALLGEIGLHPLR